MLKCIRAANREILGNFSIPSKLEFINAMKFLSVLLIFGTMLMASSLGSAYVGITYFDIAPGSIYGFLFLISGGLGYILLVAYGVIVHQHCRKGDKK